MNILHVGIHFGPGQMGGGAGVAGLEAKLYKGGPGGRRRRGRRTGM